MNTVLTSAVLSEGWSMLRDAEHDQYLLVSPETTQQQDMRPILIDVMSHLLSDKHVAMLAQTTNAVHLGPLRTLKRDSRIVKRGDETALFAELDSVPSADLLCMLPHDSAIRLRFAGFHGTVPSELIFSGLMENHCPADIVLDCLYVGRRPAMRISLAPEQMDEDSLVACIRNTASQHGAALRVDFAS